MVKKTDLRKIDEYLYEIPKEFRPDMRVPARLYADEAILEDALGDRSIEQLVNTATLPGVVRYTLAMPDIHQGYGPPIGGVIATRHPDGIISPGATGYDINCGVRVLVSNITADELRPHLEKLVNALFQNIPSGVGKGGAIRLNTKELDEVMVRGAAFAVERGYGSREDLERTEERGALAGADPAAVSRHARERGSPQLGTLGSGNHFIEVSVVEEVYDPEVADAWGLFPGQIAVWIHSGSRGLGHQVCSDYVRDFQKAVQKYNISLPDRELVCAPFNSPEGQAYFGAMASAANYAWANRQVMAELVRRTFEQVLAGKVSDWHLRQIYDVAHNIVKIEEHDVDGKRMKLIVHRKGATRAFGPGHPVLPPAYRDTGQPVLIPGDMGTGSYLLVGTEKAMRDAFGTTCHGAGRVWSRAQAKKSIRGEELIQQLRQKGIIVRAGSMAGLAEEAPDAYKDVDRVVNVVHKAGLARKVARFRPLGVIKG
ncbi:MAG: RtcB family protein [Anaerolineae bacterium]|nr:RtcB family protein [Anaerolineae bacterium]